MSVRSLILGLLVLSTVSGARAADDLAAYERRAEMDPKNFGVQFNLGVLALQAGALDKAEAALEKATKLEPKDADAWDAYGNALLGNKKVSESAAAFKKATSLNPGNQGFWANLGRALAVGGDDAGAIKAFGKAGPLGARFLCPLLNKAGDFKAAERACEGAVKMLKEKKQAEAYYNLGFARSRLGKSAEARKAFEAALKKDPGLAVAHYTLGFMDYENGKLESALGSFQKAIKAKSGDYPAAQYNQAVVLGDLGRWEQAADVYRRILKQDGDNEDAKVNLAFVVSSGSEALLNQGKDSYEAGDFGKASSAWNAALKLDPDNEQAKAFLKRVKGKAAPKANKALSAARKKAATALRAEDKKVLAEGRQALKAGKFAAAVRSLEFYVKRDPKDAKAGADLRLARSRLRQQVDELLQNAGRSMVEEDSKGAKDLIGQALALDPNNARGNQMLKQLTGAQSTQKTSAEEVKALYFKGVDSYLDGKLDEAMATWKKVLAQDPGHPDAKRSLRQAQLEQEALKARKG